jgi:predicted dehydrogenase
MHGTRASLAYDSTDNQLRIRSAGADVVEETARRRAVELDAAAYTDFREMIFEADIDAVDICLPHHLHAEAIVAAAQAGKHILCEKRSA